MFARFMILTLAALLALALVGCTAPAEEPATPDVGAPTDVPPADDSISGLRLAPGLYDLEDGTINALGTLEYISDIEGGFWLISGGTEAEGNLGTTVAVIANGDEFAEELKALNGKTIFVIGTRLEGASIRMAGPEIEITSVEEVTDTPGIAE